MLVEIKWAVLIPLYNDTVHVLGELEIGGKTLPVDFIDEVRG